MKRFDKETALELIDMSGSLARLAMQTIARYVSCLLLMIIGSISIFSLAFLSVNTVYAKNITKGIEYDQYISKSNQIVHVLIINPEQVIVKSVHANDKVHGLETVSSLARQSNAIAAINGSFFRMGENVDGLPAGILKIDGRWFGVAYGTRGALGWNSNYPNSGSENSKTINPNSSDNNINSSNNHADLLSIPNRPVLMDRVQTKTVLEINGSQYPVHGLNQPATKNKTKCILYTDAYGKKIDVLEGSTHVVIQNQEIQAISYSGSTIVPAGGFVYVMGPKAKRPQIPLAKGGIAKVQIKVQPAFKKQEIENWQTIDNIVGGIPLLIENGRILQDYGQERIKMSFTHQQHARTAIGILPKGEWVFVVVEKSQATGSPGMTLLELSNFLQKLGCEMALNLDGGGSSTLYLEGKVVNNPENELDENFVLPISRPIADAILVLPKY